MKTVPQRQQFTVGTHEQHHLKVFTAKLRSQRRENSPPPTCWQSSVQLKVQFPDE